MMMNNVMPHLIQVNYINTYTVVMTCGHSSHLTYHQVFKVTTAAVDIFYLIAVAATTGTRALASANKDAWSDSEVNDECCMINVLL